MARQPLPDPHWLSAPEACLQCGYSLRGLTAPGPCPECGTPFEERCLVVAGIAKQSGSSPARRAAFWCIAIGAIVMTQGLGLMLLFAWWMAVGLFVFVIGGLIWFVVSSPRERRGAERFAFTPSGVARLPLAQTESTDRVFLPWQGANRIEVKRIGPFWRRVRIGQAVPGRSMGNIIFDAGVRCPDQHADDVEAVIRSLMESSRPPAPTAPPVTPQPSAHRHGP